jgi:hypothetical protein
MLKLTMVQLMMQPQAKSVSSGGLGNGSATMPN